MAKQVLKVKVRLGEFSLTLGASMPDMGRRVGEASLGPSRLLELELGRPNKIV